MRHALLRHERLCQGGGPSVPSVATVHLSYLTSYITGYLTGKHLEKDLSARKTSSKNYIFKLNVETDLIHFTVESGVLVPPVSSRVVVPVRGRRGCHEHAHRYGHVSGQRGVRSTVYVAHLIVGLVVVVPVHVDTGRRAGHAFVRGTGHEHLGYVVVKYSNLV